LQGYEYFDDIVAALKSGNMKELGRLCTLDWETGTKCMIPWTSNAFTEDLIEAVKKQFGKQYWGFMMLGGASGGGMAFVVDPAIHHAFRTGVVDIMRRLKQRYAYALPFAMEPVVYDFRLNYKGIDAHVRDGAAAVLPPRYYVRGLHALLKSGAPAWWHAHAAEIACLVPAGTPRRAGSPRTRRAGGAVPHGLARRTGRRGGADQGAQRV
ncbi:MAG: hypothetical protein NTV22_09800, partial [bacterium]|nr:hypothetical protein [bacterium]